MPTQEEIAAEKEKAEANRNRQIAIIEKECEFTEAELESYKDYVNGWHAKTIREPPELSRMELVRDRIQTTIEKELEHKRKVYMYCHGTEFAEQHRDHFERVLKDADNTLVKVGELIAKHKANVPPPVTSTAYAKLENLQIPKFSGNYEDWQSFHDLFQALVDSRPIQGSAKLNYLLNALQGPAKAVISSFEITDANYDEAWSYLKSRFNVKREIVFAHIRTFDDYKPHTQESSASLRSLADALNKLVRSLKVQNIPVDTWDLILIFMALKKLDPETRKQWSLDQTTDLPKLDEFIKFLLDRAQALQTAQLQKSGNNPKPQPQASHHSSPHTPLQCHNCSQPHLLYRCPSFRALTIPARKSLVQKKKICQNCFRADHTADCKSEKSCYKCGGRHHSLLHLDPITPNPNPNPTGSLTSSHCVPRQTREHIVVLGTVVVNVRDIHGKLQPCRVFVDDGSETNFISADCLSRLGLKAKKVNVPLNVIGNAAGPVSKGEVSLNLESRVQEYQLSIKALLLDQFSGLIPRTHVQSHWPHLEGLGLSDPNFHRAQYTDILLGCARSAHILLPQIVKDPEDLSAPVALNTVFGWMVRGEAPVLQQPVPPFTSVHHVTRGSIQDSDLNSHLLRFWEAEEPPQPNAMPLSSSDVDCELQFKANHTENRDGTYTVQLPFREHPPQLGKSRESAVRRFLKVEERLTRQPAIQAEYINNIREYLSLGYLEPVPPEDMKKKPPTIFYMPHREVVKESSLSTKVRIVFDASARTSTGKSLNDVLHTGPKLQVDLFPLLTRFMTHQIAMSADIWKFYPQTSVHPSHRDFQRLVWRESPDLPLQDLRMTRVTFGVSSAPFLAIRALHELANKVESQYPEVSTVIKEDFLVDNLLSGAPNLESALELQAKILKVMESGSLKLRQWTSNSPEIIHSVPAELRDPSPALPIDEGDFVKTIGILWNPTLDKFSVKITLPTTPFVTTKRTVLSSIARTFDPLGWLSPVTIRPKVLVQELWKANLEWDEPLPLHFHQQWRKYLEELPLLSAFSVDRCAFAYPDPNSHNVTYQLHGFSDGCDTGNAACVYVRATDSERRVSVNLLSGKTKVNPITKQSTPRSELCGAVLLTSLITAVQSSIKTPFTSVHCWTDSTVVLGRISPEKKLPVFELNRIRKILAVLPSHHWHHVSGTENPADAPSRGISAQQLLAHPLWLHGPDFLREPIPDHQTVAVNVAIVSKNSITELIHRCSSYLGLRWTVGYVLRFLHNSRPADKRKTERRVGLLSVAEIDAAMIVIVKNIQAESFPEQIAACEKRVPLKAPYKFLTPFLDKHGILRVGGRLEFASVPYSQKHPVLLPKKHIFCESLARYTHWNKHHAGPSLLLALLREQVWIVRGPDLVKDVVRKCYKCHLHSATTGTQIMGQLPSSRVTPAPPFSKCGIDYAGPFHLASRTGRKPQISKSYVCLFVCMATKAIHLEVSSDLSTANFLAALERFISRRGLPSDIYSDEGTNFVGAKSELEEIQHFLENEETRKSVHSSMTNKGINFHFNPPASPHHGGLWEAGVKRMKFHLRRVVGTRHLTTEEFSTLLCQVEAILNSRPLSPMSNNPNDLHVLTAGHFIIGRPLVALPHPDLGHLPDNRMSRWQLVQKFRQDIWKSWTRDLSTLQPTLKWHVPQKELEIGNLVLVLDDTATLGPQKWKRGRVTAVIPGKEGNSRVYDVRTNITPSNPRGTILRRPIVKLSLLPIH